jgi:drug/metabolite transporter (DMT)-like permease
MTAMLCLCCAWSFTYVTVKLAMPGVSPVMQSAIRFVVASGLLLLWARWRGTPLFARDGSLWPGLLAGVLFAAEFIFISAGLTRTGASRMAVFVYLAPCFTALGLHWAVRSERLSYAQWLGVLVAFAGIVVAFGDGFVSEPGSLLGDAFGVIAAALWAATTVVVRVTKLASISAAKTLFYQLGVAALTLPFASKAVGEAGVVALTPLVLACLAYQSIVVAFASYLVWFWLLTRYFAARLSVFAFLTPMLSVVAGALVLDEPVRPAFLLALLLVAGGIYLVNRRPG